MAVKADITIDIDKQVGNLQNLTNIYNARVGDNKTPLTVAWRKNDLPLNLKGLHAYIVGKTGDGSFNEETGKIDFPVGTPVSQFEDDGTGTLDGGQSGLTTLLIPKQMWQKSGVFAGYIGLKSADGSVFTSKDIWFKVLGNVLDAGVEINYFIGDFDKALAEAEKKLEDKSANFDQVTNAALDQLKQKYQQKVADADGAMDETNAAIAQYLATVQNLVSQIESLQNKLKTENVVSYAQYYADQDQLKTLVENKLANAKVPPEAFTNFSDIQNKYPDGPDGRWAIAMDTKHVWVHTNGIWKDCGEYPTQTVADNSLSNRKLDVKSRKVDGTYDSPIFIDWNNSKIIVPQGSFHGVSELDALYALAEGETEIVTEEAKKRIAQALQDAKTQEEKEKIASTDITFRSGGCYVAFVPTGNPKTQFKFYEASQNIPQNEYYVGFIQKDTVDNVADFIWPVLDWNNRYVGGQYNRANRLSDVQIPRISDNLMTTNKWSFDYKTGELVVKGNANYTYKRDIFHINEGRYKLLDLDSDHTAGYIYLSLQKDVIAVPKLSPKGIQDIKVDNPYIGYVDRANHIFEIRDQGSSIYRPNYCHFVGNSKAQVDFENNLIHIPASWYVVTPYKRFTGFSTDIKIPDRASGLGLYFDALTYDKTGLAKDAFILSVDPDLKDNTDIYYIGVIDPSKRFYDFGELGNSDEQNATDNCKILFESKFPWNGKKVTCLGDSITQGDSGEGGIIPSYVPKMQKWLQTSPTNAGLCGSKITDVQGDNTASFVDRLDNIKDQDVITIFGGINDFQWDAPLGKMSDSADTTSTFYGALKHIIVTLSRQNPKAKLMFITPMKTIKFKYHTFDDSGNLMKNGNGNTQLDFVDAIKQVADYYSIPVLDMYSCSNYSPYLPSQVGHDNFTADGLHPTAHGYERIAHTIAEAINNL